MTCLLVSFKYTAYASWVNSSKKHAYKLMNISISTIHNIWYFVTKLWEKNCSSDRDKLLKFEAEGREVVKVLRSLEQFIKTVKVRTI